MLLHAAAPPAAAAAAVAAAHQFGASAALGSLNMLPQLMAWCLEV
jgi:hypothetical protein